MKQSCLRAMVVKLEDSLMGTVVASSSLWERLVAPAAPVSESGGPARSPLGRGFRGGPSDGQVSGVEKRARGQQQPELAVLEKMEEEDEVGG